MHRLASIPGQSDQGAASLLVEQPSAPLLWLTSADSDLQALADLLAGEPDLLGSEVRGLNLAALQHPAAIDHYLATSMGVTRLVLIRLLGGRGHWSYGLERWRSWAMASSDRQWLVVAGTEEEEESLASLGTVATPVTRAIGRCLREGGPQNLRRVLASLRCLLEGEPAQPPDLVPLPDPLPHDWRHEPGPRVGLVFYRAQYQAGDTELAEASLVALRNQGLCPRALWVSGLRNQSVQRGVRDLLRREGVEAVLCATSFASVQFEEAGLGAPLWEALNVPVLQLLCSTQSRQHWQQSSIGLGPLDLSLQVALPELDGRITSRVGAFKELVRADQQLTTAIYHYRPDPERLDWIAQLLRGWVELRQTSAAQRRLALVLANYPTRNSRVANGVGLDTPASTALMLQWLRASGHDLGSEPLPEGGDALIQRLLAGRTNDPESGHRPALDHLPLSSYLAWYQTLPASGRALLEGRWGPPAADEGLEPGRAGPGFPIRGLRYGSVVVLIQPERGYDRDPSLNYHSPDLPPTHAYLAQYLWLRQVAGSQLVVHVGKHGNLEWLPGKGLGLSQNCFPEWALGPMPHLYPFIVNDPGEGSQAKRRAQAVILDHLTPPLGRAGLHGPLQQLEVLLDEYWEARQLGSARLEPLRRRLAEQLAAMNLPGGEDPELSDLEARLEEADGYLCELKEAQIRTGLHTFGTLPAAAPLAELLLCLARPPMAAGPGLTQAIGLDLGLGLDPWCDADQAPLSCADQRILVALNEGKGSGQGAASLRCCGDGVERLEQRAFGLIRSLLSGSQPSELAALPGPATKAVLERVSSSLLPNLLACGEAERLSFLAGVAGERIAAGPSGAPTRGRPDLLPTGRNFYSVDLRGLPTEAAWDLGRRSAELLLDLHLQEQGEDLSHLALSVWGTATMRNGGEDIGQVLALMGVRPVWDGPTRRMVGLEVIPLSLLGRPRVDVTLRISGLFRDAFPQLIDWVNQATALVAGLDESELENPLAASARREGHSARVYGSAPGAYGAGLQGLIESGQWDDRRDLGEAFLNWSGWRYETGTAGGCEARSDRSGLEQRLRQIQVVLHNQDNREHDLLDSDDYYQFQGGLSAATERLRGTAPDLWFGDHSRHQRPRMHRLERELDKVLRSRVLNPRWIEGMKAHGYKGAFEMAASLDYLFAYDASTGRVPDWSYGAICQAWLQSESTLAVLRSSNPWALRDMAERLLEAHHRGLWEGANEDQLDHLRQLVLSSESLVEA